MSPEQFKELIDAIHGCEYLLGFLLVMLFVAALMLIDLAGKKR